LGLEGDKMALEGGPVGTRRLQLAKESHDDWLGDERWVTMVTVGGEAHLM
jgi:hypothetical protein